MTAVPSNASPSYNANVYPQAPQDAHLGQDNVTRIQNGIAESRARFAAYGASLHQQNDAPYAQQPVATQQAQSMPSLGAPVSAHTRTIGSGWQPEAIPMQDMQLPAAPAPGDMAASYAPQNGMSNEDTLALVQAEFARFNARILALSEGRGVQSPAGAIAAPVRQQPMAVPPMRIPSPVYINQVPDVHVQSFDQNYVINNANVHVQHNQRADAQYEAMMDMIGPARVGRAAVWWSHEHMPYTADVASTGISEQDFEEFWRGCDSIKAEGLERVFSVSNTILTMLVCGACIVCDIDNAFHGPRWSPEHIGYRMGVLAYEQNAKLAAKGVRAIFRANYVPGMGHKLELHHAG